MNIAEELIERQREYEIRQESDDYEKFCALIKSENPTLNDQVNQNSPTNSKFSYKIFEDVINATSDKIKLDIKQKLKSIGQELNDKSERKKYRDRLIFFLNQNTPLIIYITVQKCIESCITSEIKEHSTSYQDLLMKVGIEIERQRIFNKDARNRTGMVKKILNQYRKELEEKGKSFYIDGIQEIDKIVVGGFFVNKVVQNFDAFETVSDPDNKHMFVLKFTDKISKYYDPEILRDKFFTPSKKPMICPPNDWDRKLKHGGYLTNLNSPLVHTKSRSHRTIITNNIHRVKSEKLPFLSAANHLQKTPWKINPQMLEYIATDLKSQPRKTKKDKYKLQISKQTIEVATEFRDKTFYLPWYLDFRGRMYPDSIQISPQSDELGKSLLLFKEELKVTDSALFHLAVYGFCKYTSKKVSHTEMIKWIDSHQNIIFQTAEDPYKNQDFLEEASDKYLFLAFCLEWHKIHFASKNTRTTSLPVYVDGTCNGFQHYSALLRDERGAESVNLIPSSKPKDFYEVVAQAIHRHIRLEHPNDPLLNELTSTYINRKTLKPSIISAGYGSHHSKRAVKLANLILSKVTSSQATPDHLVDIATETNVKRNNFVPKPSKTLIDSCHKIERALNSCIEEHNPAFFKIFSWIKKTSKIVSETGECLTWTNSAGLPVCNCYYKHPLIEVSVQINYKRHRISFKDYSFNGTLPLDLKQIRRSIAPNYIHSVDAAHAAKLIDVCSKSSINSLASVHDSFGTHATNMETMHKLIRETFVEIHSNNQIKLFKEEIEQRHSVKLPELPEFGNLDLNQVLNSKYFFY